MAESDGPCYSGVADFDTAIRLDPKFNTAYQARGLTEYYAGALPQALADFEKLQALDPAYAYAALWRDIVATRAKQPSPAGDGVARIPD